ncbi:MAG: hypothetical protein J0H74_35995 [Chitinophagaceae bacterium]|nr:hypothetical protein [Chitinophagaceae bacterium]
MVRRIILTAILFVGFSDLAKSQEISKSCDSLALSFLHENYPQDNIGFRTDTTNGKVRTGRNFYSYESFHLRINDILSIFLINFGLYDSEGGNYVVIIDKEKSDKTYLFLGKNSLEDDLAQLNKYFMSKKSILKNRYKLEILDLFLRCKKGQIKTPVYIH